MRSNRYYCIPVCYQVEADLSLTAPFTYHTVPTRLTLGGTDNGETIIQDTIYWVGQLSVPGIMGKSDELSLILICSTPSTTQRMIFALASQCAKSFTAFCFTKI